MPLRTAEEYPMHVGDDGFPIVGSVWRGHDGVLYVILMMTNTQAPRQDLFPTTVVFQSDMTGHRYSVPLTQWWEKRVRPE